MPNDNPHLKLIAVPPIPDSERRSPSEITMCSTRICTGNRAGVCIASDTEICYDHHPSRVPDFTDEERTMAQLLDYPVPIGIHPVEARWRSLAAKLLEAGRATGERAKSMEELLSQFVAFTESEIAAGNIDGANDPDSLMVATRKLLGTRPPPPVAEMPASA